MTNCERHIDMLTGQADEEVCYAEEKDETFSGGGKIHINKNVWRQILGKSIWGTELYGFMFFNALFKLRGYIFWF